MVVFYTNYLLLIDRYLTSRRIGRFLGWNLLLIGTVMVGVHLLFRYVLPPDAMRPPMVRPWQETLRFFTGNALLYMLVVGVGVAIRMTGAGTTPRRPAANWSAAAPKPNCRTSRAS